MASSIQCEWKRYSCGMSAGTLIKSLRVGSQQAQKAAAERIGVNATTLAAYEGGRFTPSEAKSWEIARALALGSPSKGEGNPRFLITYWLFGQRFLYNGLGRLVVFRDPWAAHAQADRLADLLFPEVAVVPTWRSARRSLIARHRAAGETAGEEMRDPLAALLEHVEGIIREVECSQMRADPGGWAR
jgi:transcriptional regulator with XRE-family HTH domain